MKTVNSKTVLSALAVVVVVAALWGFSRLEWEAVVIEAGFASEARQNPFLAAQRLLRSQDIEVTHHVALFSVDSLPSPDSATLVLAGSRQGLGARRVRQLWQWVEAGGHLVTDAQVYTDPVSGESDDLILQRLGLRHYSSSAYPERWREGNSVMDALIKMAGQRRSACVDGQVLVDFQLGEGSEPVQARIRGDGWLMDSRDAALASAGSDDKGAQFIQFGVGEGLVSVFTDLSHWSNRYVECHDHAYLLWYLVGATPQAWFIYSSELPSLPRLLWRQAPLVLLLASAWLVFWLWRRGRRFGPLVSKDVRSRRSLTEHLHASALFMWRYGQREHLLETLRIAIHQGMAERHPGFQRLNRVQQHALIAHLVDMDEHQVAWALDTQGLSDKGQFVNAVQLLQTIRNSL